MNKDSTYVVKLKIKINNIKQHANKISLFKL